MSASCVIRPGFARAEPRFTRAKPRSAGAQPGRSCAALALCVCILVSATQRGAQAAERAPRFKRPDVTTIRAETRRILADERFAPRQSFWDWLAGKLKAWKMPEFHLWSGFARFLFWLFMTWCVLTLIAILAHMAWQLWMLVRRPSWPGLGLVVPHRGGAAVRSLEDLRAQMAELAERGAFREAIGVMVIALLRWLDRAGIVRFHESKTNGDYVREFPAGRAERGRFRQFVLASDRAVYGRAACGRQTYDAVKELFDQVHSDVEKQP